MRSRRVPVLAIVLTVGGALTAGQALAGKTKLHQKVVTEGIVLSRDTATTYYGDCAAVTKDTFTIRTLNSSGVGAITGSGKCAGGTGIHKHQVCTYKLSGTYNSKTMVSHTITTGTVTG
jgi:hypothetical protein